MELKPDLIIADRFRLVRPLGEGGMGAVWLADHISLKIPCAVKFMRPEVAAEPAYRARFDREALAAAQIRSPHVVHLLDHGVWEGSPYIAMECLEGEDLGQRLVRLGRLGPEETAGVVAQVARALTKAHAAGLVHRDLKPGNIFLVRDDDREIVKVLDFGIAKMTGPTTGGHTKTGAVVGTPYYMSPEQAQGTKAVDHRTDLWALGVVVYECLTGKLPFMSDAFGDLVLKIIVEPLPVPSRVAPVPPGFDAWWARAVARDPAARFQSAKEMADTLAVALGVESGAGPSTGLGTSTPKEMPAAAVKTPSGDVAGVAVGTSPHGGSTTEASVATLGAPARPRSGVLAAVAVLSIMGLGTAAYLAMNGRPAPVRGATGVAPTPPAPVSAPPQAATAPPPTAPAVEASAAPTVVASAAPTVVASVVPTASASARPAGGHVPRPGVAKPVPTAAPQGHDIGF